MLEHGTGCININDCRIEGPPWKWGTQTDITGSGYGTKRPSNGDVHDKDVESDPNGRWPANLILDEKAGAELDRQSGELISGDNCIRRQEGFFMEHGGLGSNGDLQTTYGDSGGASRFFYCAKASQEDRDEGLEGMELKDGGTLAQDKWSQDNFGNSGTGRKRHNHHPTVKPTDLMQYLVRLVTPPGCTVLDPFMGSGSTGKGAVREGFKFIGIERDAEYIPIAIARINAPAQVELL